MMMMKMMIMMMTMMACIRAVTEMTREILTSRCASDGVLQLQLESQDFKAPVRWPFNTAD